MTLMGIGAVAKRAGVGIDTVRYYERAGLLEPKQRLRSGYRRYSDIEVARLRFIRRAQALGFSLKEIHELLALSTASRRGARQAHGGGEARDDRGTHGRTAARA